MIENRRANLEQIKYTRNNFSWKVNQATKNTYAATDCWLTPDTTDLASYLLAKDNLHIVGFQPVLPFSAIETGGIVGTFGNATGSQLAAFFFMTISSLGLTANLPLWT